MKKSKEKMLFSKSIKTSRKLVYKIKQYFSDQITSFHPINYALMLYFGSMIKMIMTKDQFVQTLKTYIFRNIEVDTERVKYSESA